MGITCHDSHVRHVIPMRRRTKVRAFDLPAIVTLMAANPAKAADLGRTQSARRLYATSRDSTALTVACQHDLMLEIIDCGLTARKMILQRRFPHVK